MTHLAPSSIWFWLRRFGVVACLALAGAACGGGESDPAPAPASATRITKTLTVDGLARTYTLHLPPGHSGASASALPLVIAMHGGGGSRGQFEASSQLTPAAESARVAVMYPDGTATGLLGLLTWNAGLCCGSAVSANVDDVTFLRAAIDDAVANHKLDARRVYATGHSNGGMMAYRLACDLADRVAAIAANASVTVANPCSPSRPVPVLHMHSKLDRNVPLEGGVGVGPSGVNYPALMPTLLAWATRNGCATQAPQPEVTTQANAFVRTRWRDCAGQVEVDYYLTEDGGHSWPGGSGATAGGDPSSQAIRANDLLLAFFAKHALP